MHEHRPFRVPGDPPMSGGLAALLDDVAALARAAAASVDDIAAATGKAGAKAAGVVIDDAAVTPQYVTGIEPGSPAEAMGLRLDDVILALNDIEMVDARAFTEVASQRVRTWQIILQRDGRVSRAIVSG